MVMYEELSVLVGAKVCMLKFSDQFVSIVLYGGVNREKKYAELQIEADFLFNHDEKSVIIEPARVQGLAPVLQLLHARLVNIVLAENEAISLAFSNGYEVIVNPIEKYEAWNLFADDIGHYGASGA